ncbi:acyl-CoA dehydrogenase C-terminal domain-containing protein [Inmirania thermothiophila]|uniref:3-methylmercaptopropionyl-CoA dehydrogenase n=1 Tax=Inmirania thermothiophila TaxID=1750597 RepID=A0A3N1Y8R1_9GAMM|nr:acyl-CoA dehydrogenase C-terminal domain-containing protein [Inmirania thermothiophila]ROR35183.1 alkylation response protein AidB-like acyl-CoA dehydrogenase [Inmirania thermothiophila]
MAQYQAPLRDMRFVLYELLDAGRALAELPGCEEATPDLVGAVLEEAGRIAEEVLFPLNRSGDEEGCRLEDGQVSTPRGFREAYRLFCEGGWPGIGADPDYGGQGLPTLVEFQVHEMWSAANVAFSLYPVLTAGAYRAIRAHADEALRRRFLPPMVEGRWSGTMCLTEAHCGTDLGLLRTRAVPAGDGGYRITGTKIFITGGDQDLTENIVHLVLARLPDAPEGVRGISLFLVPKRKVREDGSLGEANGVSPGAIEHKMGIRGAATCVMNFDDAEGYLVGPPNKGLACMFTMMNLERLAIGMQGLGLGEVAYQSAAAYARERLQGRFMGGPRDPDRPADPIVVHPDVRRMLLTARAYNEGNRALCAWAALAIDQAERHPDPAVREAADDLVALLTPIIKAFVSDCGFEVCNLGLQVFGGHGYIREHGMEQLVRDARIAQIYEGTNGIQALDLVRRKLFLHDGRLPGRFFAPVEAFVREAHGRAGMGEFVVPLEDALRRLRAVTAWLQEEGPQRPEELGAAATDYLRMFGLTALAYLWARAAAVALERLDGPERPFYEGKLAVARFYMQRLLPQVHALEAAVRAGGATLMALPDEAF